MAETQLSPDTFERLQTELDDLRTRGRVDIARAIEAARALGDLSENGDYHAAKDSQGKMEGRIRQLQAMLENAAIVDSDAVDASDIVTTGVLVSAKCESDVHAERSVLCSIGRREKG